MRRQLFLALALLWTLMVCQSQPCLADAASGGETGAHKKLLVTNFGVSGCGPELGTAASVALQNVIANYDQERFAVVKRDVLNDLLASQGFGLTAVLGKSQKQTVTADFLLEGDLAFASDQFTLLVRLVDVASQMTVREHAISAGSLKELLAQLPKIGLIVLDLTLAIEAGPLPPVSHVEYNSWYSDANGIHKGGQILLDIDGDVVTGLSVESYGTAAMNGTIQGDVISGVYEASYGYGNFEFSIEPGWQRLTGSYYQVSNGARGAWSGHLK